MAVFDSHLRKLAVDYDHKDNQSSIQKVEQLGDRVNLQNLDLSLLLNLKWKREVYLQESCYIRFFL